MSLSLGDIVMLIEGIEDTGSDQSLMQNNSFNNNWVLKQMKDGNNIKFVAPSLKIPSNKFDNPRAAVLAFLRINSDANLSQYYRQVRNEQAKATKEYGHSRNNKEISVPKKFYYLSALEVATFNCYQFIKKYFLTPEAARNSKLKDFEISDIRNALANAGYWVDMKGDNNPSADLNIHPMGNQQTNVKRWKGKSIASTIKSRSKLIDKRLDNPTKPNR